MGLNLLPQCRPSPASSSLEPMIIFEIQFKVVFDALRELMKPSRTKAAAREFQDQRWELESTARAEGESWRGDSEVRHSSCGDAFGGASALEAHLSISLPSFPQCGVRKGIAG